MKKINMGTSFNTAMSEMAHLDALAAEEEEFQRIEERMNVIGQKGNDGLIYEKPDMVNSPPHYQSETGIECIAAIRAALGKEGFISYCRGNVQKYLWRDKNDRIEDWKKAQWYLNKMLEEVEK